MSGIELALMLKEIGPVVQAGVKLAGIVKSWIDKSFEKGLISAEEQKKLKDEVDSWGLDSANDNYPDSWKPQ